MFPRRRCPLRGRAGPRCPAIGADSVPSGHVRRRSLPDASLWMSTANPTQIALPLAGRRLHGFRSGVPGIARRRGGSRRRESGRHGTDSVQPVRGRRLPDTARMPDPAADGDHGLHAIGALLSLTGDRLHADGAGMSHVLRSRLPDQTGGLHEGQLHACRPAMSDGPLRVHAVRSSMSIRRPGLSDGAFGLHRDHRQAALPDRRAAPGLPRRSHRTDHPGRRAVPDPTQRRLYVLRLPADPGHGMYPDP